MEKTYKSFTSNLEIKEDQNESGVKTFEIQGYITTFGNVDRDGDIIDKDAFNSSLGKKNIGLFMNHRYDLDSKLGLFISFVKDDHGIIGKAKAILNDTTIGIYEKLKAGILTDFSVGFTNVQREQKGKNWIIKSCELLEVSIVGIPANPKANILDIKELKTIREVESLLCDKGLSQREAKTLISIIKASIKDTKDNEFKNSLIDRLNSNFKKES